MINHKNILNNSVQVLFQGNWLDTEVGVDEVPSSRLINSSLEENLMSSWNKTLKSAGEQNRKIWDSVIYRFENSEMLPQKLNLFISTIPFSIRLEMNKYTEEIKQLGELYSPRGMFSSCLVKTTDDHFVFVEKSNIYMTQKKYAWVGGVFSKSEFVVNSGKNLFESAKCEVIEELGIGNEHIHKNILKMGYLTENWNVCFLFSVQLLITKKELLERFQKSSDDEVKKLIFVASKNIENSLDIFEEKDKIKFALLGI